MFLLRKAERAERGAGLNDKKPLSQKRLRGFLPLTDTRSMVRVAPRKGRVGPRKSRIARTHRKVNTRFTIFGL